MGYLQDMQERENLKARAAEYDRMMQQAYLQEVQNGAAQAGYQKAINDAMLLAKQQYVPNGPTDAKYLDAYKEQQYMNGASPQQSTQVPANVQAGGRAFLQGAPSKGEDAGLTAYLSQIRANKGE